MLFNGGDTNPPRRSHLSLRRDCDYQTTQSHGVSAQLSRVTQITPGQGQIPRQSVGQTPVGEESRIGVRCLETLIKFADGGQQVSMRPGNFPARQAHTGAAEKP